MKRKEPAPATEIVGAKIGTLITNSRATIRAALESNRKIEFLSRPHMELMAAMDLGPKWHQMSIGPTLFLMDKDGNPVGRGTE